MSRKFTKLVNFVASPEDYELWKTLAKEKRLTTSCWIRQACQAYAGVEVDLTPTRIIAPRAERLKLKEERQVGARLLELAGNVSPEKCENRLPKGAFCKKCGRIHK